MKLHHLYDIIKASETGGFRVPKTKKLPSLLNKDHWVTKRNVLNEMRSSDMSLRELRIFAMYLSRINPNDAETRRVRFSLDEFLSVAQIEQDQQRYSYYKKLADELVRKAVTIDLPSGGFTAFTLFTTVEFDIDPADSVWYFSLDAHEKAMPLFFEYRGHFFKYRLWNALRLKSKNQIRLYEILKQNEYLGYRVISVADLKSMMGINEKEYPQFKYFKRDVIDICQSAIGELTDIAFTYEVHSKRGRKIHELKFTIIKNEAYSDTTGLNALIPDDVIDAVSAESSPKPFNINDTADMDESEVMELEERGVITSREAMLIDLRDLMGNKFSIEQVKILADIVKKNLPSIWHDQIKRMDHFQSAYNTLQERVTRGNINNPFAYMKKIIESED